VNGAAKSAGYDDIAPIWKENPDAPETRISLGPLIEKGLALCEDPAPRP